MTKFGLSAEFWHERYSTVLDRLECEQRESAELEKTLSYKDCQISALKQVNDELFNEVITILKDYGDQSYVNGCRYSEVDECLGEESKLKWGTFGPAELKAHRKASEAFGKHRGAWEVINKLLHTRDGRVS